MYRKDCLKLIIHLSLPSLHLSLIHRRMTSASTSSVGPSPRRRASRSASRPPRSSASSLRYASSANATSCPCGRSGERRREQKQRSTPSCWLGEPRMPGPREREDFPARNPRPPVCSHWCGSVCRGRRENEFFDQLRAVLLPYCECTCNVMAPAAYNISTDCVHNDGMCQIFLITMMLCSNGAVGTELKLWSTAAR